MPFAVLIGANLILMGLQIFLLGKLISFGGVKVPGIVLSSVLMQFQLMNDIIAVLKYRKSGARVMQIMEIISLGTIIGYFVTSGVMGTVVCIGIKLCAIAVVFVIGVYEMQTDQISRKLKRQAVTDDQTGIWNSRKFGLDLERAVVKSLDSGEPVALVMMNLDDFKRINEVRGVECGNEVLCEIAQRWNSVTGPGESLYRVNGDDFAIIIRESDDREKLEERVRKYTNRLIDPVITDKYENFLTVSCGIAICPYNATDPGRLRSCALSALSTAKERRGRNRRISMISFYDSTMFLRIHRDLYVYDVLRRSVEEELLEVCYQPQYNPETGRVRGFEALARLTSPTGEHIPPDEFIAVAERHGVIWMVGSYVMEQAAKAFAEALKTASPDMQDVKVAVNVSGMQLDSDFFYESCMELLNETGLDPRNLMLEITESVLVKSTSDIIDMIERIHHTGVTFSMDDFGTGYSSMSYLNDIPFDQIKIDKSFIDNMMTDKKNANFIRSMIGAGHDMGIDVVAEGIEKREQLELLRDYGCDLVQGFYYSEPVDVQTMLSMMKDGHDDTPKLRIVG